MVLEFEIMKRIFLITIVSVLIVATCGQNKNVEVNKIVNENITQTSPNETEKFSFNNYDFVLTNEDGDCVLSYKNKKADFDNQVKLTIPSPCKVVRDTNTNQVKFDNTISPTIFQIAGGISKDKNRCEKGSFESSKLYQLIIFNKNGELKLGSVIQLENCISEGLNNGEIYWAAEDEKGIQWRSIHNVSEEEYLSTKGINIFNHLGYVFELKNENNQCILKYQKGKNENELKLDLSAPCKVVRNESYERIEGKDIIFRFQQINRAVFMIAGGIKKDVCKYDTASNYQAIIINNDSIKLGGLRNVITCLPGGPDGAEWSIAATEK
jgi:hypothetical protein